MKHLLKNPSLLILLLLVAGKVSGFIKDALLAYYFGAGIESDAFFLSSSVSSLLYIALYASIAIVIVPKHTAALKDDGCVADLYTSYIVYLAASVLLGLMTYHFSEEIIGLLASNANDQVLSEASIYLKLISLTFPLSTGVAILNAIQSVRRTVFLVYLVPVFNNVLFCIGMVIFNGDGNLINIIVFSILSWAVLLFINLSSEKHLISKSISVIISARFTSFNYATLVIPGLFILVEQLALFVPIYFSSMSEVGDLTVYALANKLIMLVSSLALVVITANVLPKLAKAASSPDQIRHYLIESLGMLVMFSIPALVFLISMSEEVVDLAYTRGGFSDENKISVIGIFSIIVLALPLMVYRDLINRAFIVLSKARLGTILTVLITLIYFLLSWFLFPDYSIKGVAYAMVSSTFLHVILLIVFLFTDQRKKMVLGSINVISRKVLCGTAIIAPFMFIDINSVVFCALFCVLYVGLLFILNDPTIKKIIQIYV